MWWCKPDFTLFTVTRDGKGDVLFGSADRKQLAHIAQNTQQLTRITQQLGDIAGRLQNLAVELATVKQQVSDQQQTLHRIGQDTAVLTTGLAEIKTAARDVSTRLHDLVTARPADRTGEPVPAPGSRPPAEAEPDADVLRAAAGIAHATLVAHRDTWAFLIEVAAGERHFHVPGQVDDHDGCVSVRFSGPSIVAALTRLARVSAETDNPVTRAVADQIRHKITAVVHEVVDNPRADGDGAPVRIVVDDRPARPAPEERPPRPDGA